MVEATTKPGSPTAKPAVETTKIALNTEEWIDIGAGPMLLGSDGDIVFSVSDNSPRHPKREGFFVLATWPPLEVRTTHHIWVMSATVNEATLFYAPL